MHSHFWSCLFRCQKKAKMESILMRNPSYQLQKEFKKEKKMGNACFQKTKGRKEGNGTIHI